MKLLPLSSAIFFSICLLALCFSSRGLTNEPEHLCYFVTQSNRILNLSSVCPSPKKKSRSIKQRSSTEIPINTSGIKPPKFSHYPPPKFQMNK